MRDKTPAPETRKPAPGPTATTTKKKAAGTKKTKGAEKTGPRAKSRSPNPSFCSVLSKVKDFELGVYTPKTALPQNVDILSPRYFFLSVTLSYFPLFIGSRSDFWIHY